MFGENNSPIFLKLRYVDELPLYLATWPFSTDNKISLSRPSLEDLLLEDLLLEDPPLCLGAEDKKESEKSLKIREKREIEEARRCT